MKSRSSKALFFAVAVFLALVVWSRCPERTARDRREQAEQSVPADPGRACLGWPAWIPRDPQRLQPFLSEGFRLLMEQDPLRAWDAFSSQPDTPAVRVGRLRAMLETGKTLVAARDAAFEAQRVYLDGRLDAGLSVGAGEEAVPLLRAALALQSGETSHIAQWIDRIPESSPLAPAAAWLTRVAPTAPTERDPAAAWWGARFPEWAALLRGLECPVETLESDTLQQLADWVRNGHVPPPATWRTTLRFQRPDLRVGPCNDRTGELTLHDPSVYTILAQMVLEQVTREATRDDITAVLAAEAWEALGLPRPGALCARLESDQVAWNRPDSDVTRETLLPLLVYGDLLSPEAVRKRVAGLCEGERTGLEADESCPRNGDEARRRLQYQLAWEKGCVAWLTGQDPELGRIAEQFHLYGAVARSRYLRPLDRATCPREATLQAYQFWKGVVGAPSPWASLEARLRWVGVEARSRTFRDGLNEMFLLAERDAVFFPLAEMVRGAALALRPGAGEMASTMR